MEELLGKERYWWFCAKPSICSVSGWELNTIQKHTWYNEKGNKRRVFCNFLNAQKGDITIFYESSPTMAVLAIAQIVSIAPHETISFKKLANIAPIPFSKIKETPTLQNMEFLKTPNGSFFKLSPMEFESICSLTAITE